jgi:hypothetical protein
MVGKSPKNKPAKGKSVEQLYYIDKDASTPHHPSFVIMQ